MNSQEFQGELRHCQAAIRHTIRSDAMRFKHKNEFHESNAESFAETEWKFENKWSTGE